MTFDINKWIDTEIAKHSQRLDAGIFPNMIASENCAEIARGAALQIIGDPAALIDNLVNLCHNASIRNGFYHDRVTGEPIERNVGELLALVHSEVSETLEAYRTDAASKHLPDFMGEAEEMADIIIRVFDLAGYRKIPLGSAFLAKRTYNDVRPDHKREARLASGGKKF